MNTPIRVSAVALFNASGELLTVRKRGTSKYMLPGGKPEPGESDRACAVREISEEVGVQLRFEGLMDLGNWVTAAANEPDTDVHAAVFSYGPAVGEVRVQAEIDSGRWIDPRGAIIDDYAPLLTELLPLLDSQRDQAKRRSSGGTGGHVGRRRPERTHGESDHGSDPRPGSDPATQ